jgi:hypothetical protein
VDKLSKETCLDIANYGRGVIKEALKDNTMVPTSVYEAPEMVDMRIDRVVAAIVNYALNKADLEAFAKCPHEPYRGTPRCAEITCPNYAGRHNVR